MLDLREKLYRGILVGAVGTFLADCGSAHTKPLAGGPPDVIALDAPPDRDSIAVVS